MISGDSINNVEVKALRSQIVTLNKSDNPRRKIGFHP